MKIILKVIKNYRKNSENYKKFPKNLKINLKIIKKFRKIDFLIWKLYIKFFSKNIISEKYNIYSEINILYSVFSKNFRIYILITEKNQKIYFIISEKIYFNISENKNLWNNLF